MSPIRSHAAKCPFEPSCSRYSHQTIDKYGFFIGIALTADRLTRCSKDANTNKYPFRAGFFIDPPDNNYLFGHGNLWDFSNLIENNFVNDTINEKRYFAKELYLKKEYNYSILELKRDQFNTKNHELEEYCECLIAVNHLKEGKNDEAMKILKQELNLNDSILAWNCFILKYISNSLTDNDFLNIGLCSDNFIKFPTKTEELRRLKSFTYSRLYDETTAINLLKLSDENEGINQAINLIQNSCEISSRSPVFAGILSAVIPGGGYFYCGEYAEGLSAFLTNALLGISIYSMFRNDNIGSGILVASVALPFYFGNIIGAVNSALIFNDQNRAVYDRDLLKSIRLDFYFSTDFLNQCWDVIPNE